MDQNKVKRLNFANQNLLVLLETMIAAGYENEIKIVMLSRVGAQVFVDNDKNLDKAIITLETFMRNAFGAEKSPLDQMVAAGNA
jgi:hypothetical protein